MRLHCGRWGLATGSEVFAGADQGLVDDLIHVQILIGAAATDEAHGWAIAFGEGSVLLIERLVAIIGGFDGVVALHGVIAIVAGFFGGDGAAAGFGDEVVWECVPGGFAGERVGIGEVGDAPIGCGGVGGGAGVKADGAVG